MSFYDALLFSKGQRGKQGYSAYEIAVQNGYEGTEEEWANSFLSPTGYYTKTETYNKNEVYNKDEVNNNEYFDIKLGTSTWYHNSSDAGESALNNTLKYFNSIIECHRLNYNNSNNIFESADNNINSQIANINEYVNNGGIIAGIKFHLSGLLDLFQTYGSDVICEKYGDYVLNFIDSLPYKNNIQKVWILNEGSGGSGNDAFSTTYASDIINLINRIKNEGYNVSIPLAGVYPLANMDKNLFNAMDFISLNLYPKGDYWGKNSTIEQVAYRFNYLFEIAEQYLDDRDLYITEFGCSSSWEGFSAPETYNQGGLSKPMALFMEGFFKSKFMSNIKGAFWWYYQDAFNYAPNNLLSIKNKGVVRYA